MPYVKYLSNERVTATYSYVLSAVETSVEPAGKITFDWFDYSTLQTSRYDKKDTSIHTSACRVHTSEQKSSLMRETKIFILYHSVHVTSTVCTDFWQARLFNIRRYDGSQNE